METNMLTPQLNGNSCFLALPGKHTQPISSAIIGSPDALCHAAVSVQAATRPHYPAVQDRNRALTYAELERRSNQLAWHLQSLGVGPEHIAGLYMSRSIELVLSALATLKAGGAYLPLDPALPPDRIRFMLDDSNAQVVVTEQPMAERLPTGLWRNLVIGSDSVQLTQYPASAPPCHVVAENLAYLIYTSGSTGRPKGVEVTHLNLSNLIAWHNQNFNITCADRTSQLANLGFDAAVWEIWPCLSAGAVLCLAEDHILDSPEVLRDWLVANQITVSFVPTPFAEELMRLDWPPATNLRLLLTGGDTLHRFPLPNLPFAVINNYGPTECTVVTTSGTVPARQDAQSLPSIGAPVAHAEIYILDSQGRLAPSGTPGELHIGGAGVARGYLNRPELTAEKFIPNPFHPGTRLYKSGDSARYLPDGQIAFLGRLDDQIKIRGFRIEPDEIAAVLNRHPDIVASSVIAREDIPGEKKLVAYIVTTSGELTRLATKEFLRAQLPEYMVPPIFVTLDALPLTANGKVDRAALPAPNKENVLGDQNFSPPDSVVEKRVCEIVCSVLKISQVGVDENFFLVGGHSLLGTQLIARIRDAFKVELPLGTLFDRPSVRELAREVDRLLITKIQNMSEKEAKEALGDVAN
jgi:amino acid adenylation domain-containing protein